METAKVLKHDTVIDLRIGSSFYVRLKELLGYLTDNVSEEDLEEFDRIIKAKEEIKKDWMAHMTTVILLIKAFEEKAEKEGYIVDQDITTQ